jgi:uncharacterized protein YjbI with pentapeptide repeats
VDPGLSNEWVKAFETVWAHHSAGRIPNRSASDPVSFSNTIGSQHKKWVEQLYTSRHQDNAGSPAELYVPLQLYDVMQGSPVPHDIEEVLEFSQTSDWTCISGGPGSGKSMTALHLASILGQESLFLVYLRGSQLSNIDIDITDPDQMITDSFTFKSFLKHFRASSHQTGYLVLDGIDEIGSVAQDSLGSLNQILSELKTEQAACAAHGKALRIIIFGRDAHINATITQLPPNQFKHFKLLALDGSYCGQDRDTDSIHGEDLRELWWTNYLAATGQRQDPSLPDFLTTEYDDFSEFGTDPLLATLICKAALSQKTDKRSSALPHERVNALTYTANKNDIYRTIFEQVASSGRHRLQSRHFLSVVQHIAINMWHSGGSRRVSLEAVYGNIEDENIKTAFQALNLFETAAGTEPNMLTTALYYNIGHQDKDPSERLFEFTHKTFAEYLVSTRLFDAFRDLITTIGDRDKFKHALRNWIRISHSGGHEPGLGDFCQKEAAIRYEAFSHMNWDDALNIIKDELSGDRFSDPGSSSILHIQNSASLLFFIWSSLNLERHKRTGGKFELSQNSGTFSVRDLKFIQRPNGLDFKLGSSLEPLLRESTYLTPSLSALKLTAADMSQLSFSLGHMEQVFFDEASFAMTHWSHVKTSDTNFSKSVFQQAIFHQWRILNSEFNHCLFQGARFQGADFSNCQFRETFFSQCHFSDVDFTTSQWTDVAFDRCVFTDCIFSPKNAENLSIGIDFRHCTFMEADQDSTLLSEDQIFTVGLDELL